MVVSWLLNYGEPPVTEPAFLTGGILPNLVKPFKGYAA